MPQCSTGKHSGCSMRCRKSKNRYLSDWRTNVDASVEVALCEQIRPICQLMHEAAAVTNCDWTMEPLTFEKRLPQLTSARATARMATWSAAHCRSNDLTGATEDIIGVLRLGQNVSNAALIGYLTDTAIQGLAFAPVSANIGLFRGADGQRLARVLNDSIYEQALSRSMDEEAGMHEHEAASLAALPAAEFEKEISSLESDWGRKIEQATIVSAMQQIADFYRALGKALASGSEAEYERLQETSAELERSDPIARIFLSAWDRIVDKAQRAAITREMVIAALTIVEAGTDTLPSHPDHATGKPFVYTETADGFELQSGYQLTNGVPLKMQFK
jgi:hypothetical protein